VAHDSHFHFSRHRHAAALRGLGALRTLREFERRHLDFCRTVQDRDLLCEIGYHQLTGRPLAQKQLFLLDLGSVATVQRRLRRLRRLGAIQQQRCQHDRRAVEFVASGKVLAAFARYGELLGTNAS